VPWPRQHLHPSMPHLLMGLPAAGTRNKQSCGLWPFTRKAPYTVRDQL
jgi:hypothetical protein